MQNITMEEHFLSNQDQISDQVKGILSRETLESSSIGSIQKIKIQLWFLIRNVKTKGLPSYIFERKTSPA